MPFIELKPDTYLKDSKRIICTVDCIFSEEHDFNRGSWSVTTDVNSGFNVCSCGSPEWVPTTDLDYGSARLYIQGDCTDHDDATIKLGIKDFLYVNSQVAIANALIDVCHNESNRTPIDYNDEQPVEDWDYEDEDSDW